MNLIHKLKHYLQLKIYNAALNIQKEKDELARKQLLEQFKEVGEGFYAHETCRFGGQKFMSIGKYCYMGKIV